MYFMPNCSALARPEMGAARGLHAYHARAKSACGVQRSRASELFSQHYSPYNANTFFARSIATVVTSISDLCPSFFGWRTTHPWPSLQKRAEVHTII